ncbi:MAG: serpin family protein, partial [Thermoplasmatota archaeon]
MKDKLSAYLIVTILLIGVTGVMYQVSITEKDDDGGDDYIGGDYPIDTSRVSYDPQEKSVEHVVNGNNEFSFELYHKLDDGENLFYSPWSISTALAMTYEGARNQTRQEIGEVFGYPSNASELRKAYGYLHDGYNKNESGYNMSTANSLWVQEDFPIEDDYKWLLLNYYFARAENVDFVGDPEGSCDKINSWVKNYTNGKIEELVSPGMVNSMTRLILVNAIYFKGLWEDPFSVKDTENQTFHTSGGDDVTVPMMYQEGDFNYTETEKFQILQKKYVGNDTSMLFVLPKDGDLSEVEGSLTYKNLEKWKSDIEETDLQHIKIPKFNMSTDYDMKETLKEMGMPTAFNSQKADFEGI